MKMSLAGIDYGVTDVLNRCPMRLVRNRSLVTILASQNDVPSKHYANIPEI
jgi:hypothetical protein